MRRAFVLFGGGLLGFAAGSLLLAQPVAAFLGPTVVSWSAGGCPAGIYTITSIAHKLSSTETHSITSANVQLPQATVSQQFSNLPQGEYLVSATAWQRDGQTFGSQTQTVSGQGTSGASGSFVPTRRRPPASEPRGVATPRRSEPGARSQPIVGSGLAAMDLDWSRIDLLDDDEDGRIDRVRIELANGRTWVFRIVR